MPGIRTDGKSRRPFRAGSAQLQARWRRRVPFFIRLGLTALALGRDCYRKRRWQDLQVVFKQILKRWPEDGPARMYVNRCREYYVAGPQQDWDGVYVMTHK